MGLFDKISSDASQIREGVEKENTFRFRIEQNTVLRTRPLETSKLYPHELYEVAAGKTFEIISFIDGKGFEGYIEFTLKHPSDYPYSVRTWYILSSHAQIEAINNPLSLVINQDTVLKTRPVDSAVLSDVEKQIVKAGTDFDIFAVSREDNHYKVSLKSPVDNHDCWYVFEQHVQIDVKHAGKNLFDLSELDPTNPDSSYALDSHSNLGGVATLSQGKVNDVFFGTVEVPKFRIDFLDEDLDPTRNSDSSDNKESHSSIQELTRYPNLDCPDKAILHQRFSLTVELLLEQPEDQPEIAAVSVQNTGTDELPELELVLSASGFDIEGSNTQILEVERDDDSSTRFVLIPRKVGQHKIKVDFWQHGRRIGTTRRNILVSEVPTSASVEQTDESLLLELKTAITVPPQDLDLLVDVMEDGLTLSFRLHSSKPEVDYNHKRVGQITLQGSPLDKMQGVYKEMTNMAKKVPTTPEGRELAERRLTAIGNQLWDELVSDSLKQEYWRFKPRVKSLLITSEEPWIPWEMIKPYRYDDDGAVEQEPFWCQQFALSRWLAAAGTADEMIMGKARSIAPTPTDLPSVQAELAFIEQLSTLRPGITPLSTFGTRLQVLDCFTNEEFSLLHFACHGTFDSTSPNNSAIKLSDGELRPADIRVRFTGRRPRPLIFINACHGARSEYSFTGLGGWATMLVNANVGAFIGAMWEVSDKLALQFAKTFYTQLLQENQSIAESFRLAREEIRKAAPYNSTWLAYTLYADPEGRVKASTFYRNWRDP